MVFESLVADLLNRFLGDFVENLDASQLNIGIWGGTYLACVACTGHLEGYRGIEGVITARG